MENNENEKGRPGQNKRHFEEEAGELLSPPRAPRPVSREGQPPSAHRAIRKPVPPQKPVGGQEPQKKRRRPKPKKKYRVLRALAITLVLVGLCGFMAYFALQSASDLLGLSFDVIGVVQKDEEATVNIPAGSSTSEIAKLLSKAGVVETPLTFQLYSKFKKADGKYRPGEYILNCKMSYDQVIDALKSGNERLDIVTISFPEGLSLWEIGKKLEEKEVCTAKEFADALQKGTFEYDFMKDIPVENPLRFYKYEGYVFPDTYDFFVNENPNSVVKKFFNSFNKNVTEDLFRRMEEQGMTLDETITLASIIQKEASFPDDMAAVSGVFHNRFAQPETYPQMQSDVTIFYVEKFIKPRLDIANQPMYDAYNTYKCEGLPIGPICSPGLEAIMAALYPEENEFYYFLTDKEGKFYYAVTMAEHEQNIREASKVGGVDGIGLNG